MYQTYTMYIDIGQVYFKSLPPLATKKQQNMNRTEMQIPATSQ